MISPTARHEIPSARTSARRRNGMTEPWGHMGCFHDRERQKRNKQRYLQRAPRVCVQGRRAHPLRRHCGDGPVLRHARNPDCRPVWPRRRARGLPGAVHALSGLSGKRWDRAIRRRRGRSSRWQLSEAYSALMTLARGQSRIPMPNITHSSHVQHQPDSYCSSKKTCHAPRC